MKRSLALSLPALLAAMLLAAWCAPCLGAVAAAPAVSSKPATGAKADAPAVEQPKEKTTADGFAGTSVEEFKLHSPDMNRDIEVIVVLPPGYDAAAEKRYPVLYTLHGRGAPFRVFKDMTTVHQSLKDHPMIVVGFNADRASWYLDATEKPESKFTSFFFKTLLPAIDAAYRTQADAAHRAVTGFSMGGFGAMYLTLAKSDAFASVSTMSGAFQPAGGQFKKDLQELLGDPAKNKAAYALVDLMSRLKALAAKKPAHLPPVYVTCGTEDFLIKQNHEMRDLLTGLKWPSEYVEGPGAHNFKFWKAAAPGVIDFHWRSFQPDYKPVDHAKADAGEEKPKAPEDKK